MSALNRTVVEAEFVAWTTQPLGRWCRAALWRRASSTTRARAICGGDRLHPRRRVRRYPDREAPRSDDATTGCRPLDRAESEPRRISRTDAQERQRRRPEQKLRLAVEGGDHDPTVDEYRGKRRLRRRRRSSRGLSSGAFAGDHHLVLRPQRRKHRVAGRGAEPRSNRVELRYLDVMGETIHGLEGQARPGRATEWQNATFPGTRAFFVELRFGTLERGDRPERSSRLRGGRHEDHALNRHTRRVDAHALDALESPALLERLAATTATPHGEELARALVPSADADEVVPAASASPTRRSPSSRYPPSRRSKGSTTCARRGGACIARRRPRHRCAQRFAATIAGAHGARRRAGAGRFPAPDRRRDRPRSRTTGHGDRRWVRGRRLRPPRQRVAAPAPSSKGAPWPSPQRRRGAAATCAIAGYSLTTGQEVFARFGAGRGGSQRLR